MPVVVKRDPKGGWNIVEVSTGKVKGHSDTKKDADASARIRNAHTEGRK
tara:strand:- start:42 stop:188 length:147 start_codon:yes stop_codon:yes gene_type:complete